MNYAYYPGCSLHSSAKEYDLSAKSVCKKLGIGLEEIEGWVCCGPTPVHALNHLLSVALPMRNLDLAKAKSDKVAIACAACFNRFKVALYAVRNDSEVREQVYRLAEIVPDGGSNVRVLHLLEVLCKEFGLERLKAHIVKPLKGLKVTCYYGCLLVRPPKMMEFDNPEDPQMMDELLKTAGADVVDWAFKTECCGAALSVPRTDIVLKLANDILREAKDAGTEVIAVACPLCQMNLDLRQKDVEKRYQAKYATPILYFTQLLGLAMGLSENELGLEKLIVDPRPMLREKGLL